MENNFFSGSENLYKYLVSIGLLLFTLSIYYPLNESQTLQISSAKIRAELKATEYEIDQNQKIVDKVKKQLELKELTESQRKELIQRSRVATNKILLKQFKINGQIEEVEIRESFVTIYQIVIWFSIPIGIFLMVWGFINWRIAKNNEDEIRKLEKENLQIQINRARREELSETTSN